jgi:hypothetical protein
MPTYFAGRILGDTGAISSGSNFVSVVRNSVGSYTIVLPEIASRRFLMTVVTPTGVLHGGVAPAWGLPDTRPLFARVVSSTRSALSPLTTTIVISIFDAAGAPVDSDFDFIAVERSGA